jgi:hypothetical protein
MKRALSILVLPFCKNFKKEIVKVTKLRKSLWNENRILVTLRD